MTLKSDANRPWEGRTLPDNSRIAPELFRSSGLILLASSLCRLAQSVLHSNSLIRWEPLSRPLRLSTLQVAGICLALVIVAHPKLASATTLDFEGFPDSTILTNQYPGVSFTNAIILTSGISLNEFEFPPHSGVNVVSDNNGPVTIDFAAPILSFSGYFTYSEPLTLQGFDSSSVQVASATSLFSNNEAVSGDPGSGPNELIQLAFNAGISSLTIRGDPLGGSFALDDLTYTGLTSVPEPTAIRLLQVTLFFISLVRFIKLLLIGKRPCNAQFSR